MSIQIQEIPAGIEIPCTYHSQPEEICGKPAIELLVSWGDCIVETLGSFCMEHAEKDFRVVR